MRKKTCLQLITIIIIIIIIIIIQKSSKLNKLTSSPLVSPNLPDLGADPGRFTVAECGRSMSASGGADSGRDGALRPEEGRAEEGRGATVEAELGREEGASHRKWGKVVEAKSGDHFVGGVF